MITSIRILLLFTAVVASVGQTVVVMGFIKFFDAFNDEVPDMAYTGGYLLIECRVNQCQLSNYRMELVHEKGKEVDSAKCDLTVVLRLDITETSAFGSYKCKYGEYESSKKAHLEYRFCSPLDSICSDACRKDRNEYCVYTEFDSNPCMTTSDDFKHNIHCHSTTFRETKTLYAGNKYCGVSTFGRRPRTLCEALVDEKLHKIKTRVLDPDVTDECLLRDSNATSEDTYETNLSYPLVNIYGPDASGAHMKYNDIGRVDANADVFIHVPHHYLNETMQVRINCTVKSHDGILFSRSEEVNKTERLYTYENFFESALFGDDKSVIAMNIFKFQCYFFKTGNILLADTSYYVYPTSSRDAVVKPTRRTDGRIEALHCEPARAIPARVVIIKYQWLGPSTLNLDNETSYELLPSKPGAYLCIITLRIGCKKGKDLELLSADFEADKIVEPEAAVGQGTTDGGRNGCGKLAAVGPFGVVFLLIGLASKLHGA